MLTAALTATSCTEGAGGAWGTGRSGGARAAVADAPSIGRMAEAVGADVVQHLVRGYAPGRSGDILLVPEPWNVLGQWRGGLRGVDDPRTTHATPWEYHQRVPIVLHGPGYVREGIRSDRVVDVADLAPTFADLLGLDFDAADGRPLREALVPRGKRSEPPRAIVVVAYDGGGWNLLERWPRAWPVQRRLSREGTTYLNATVGSAPPLTAPVHATMGTGSYPRTHGVPENTARRPDGSIGEMFFQEADPRLLDAETVADAWDRKNGNRPWVGLLGFESWHLGMMGAGGRADGGDQDVALLWERDAVGFWTNEEVYRLLPYLPGEEALERHLRDLDIEDGERDGRWRGHDLDREGTFLIPATPAFVRFQGDVLAEMVRREPIGRDGLTDLLFVELKSTDYAGHVWNMLSEEVREVLSAQDEVLGRLIGLLDDRVGRGRYVLALTADHGQSPIPETRGGVRIDRFELESDINEAFGAPIVEALHPSEVFLNTEAMGQARVRPDDVARFVGDYRYRDGLPEGTDLSNLSDDALNRRVFAAALPGSFLIGLSGDQVRSLGTGDYREGDLTSPPGFGQLLDEAGG